MEKLIHYKNHSIINLADIRSIVVDSDGDIKFTFKGNGERYWKIEDTKEANKVLDNIKVFIDSQDISEPQIKI